MAKEYTENKFEVIKEYLDPRLGTLTIIEGRSNILNGDVRDTFEMFLDDFDREVLPIKREQSFGFSPRKITGSNNWSNHASGTAVDINGSDFPMFKKKFTDTQRSRTQALLKRYPVIRWGGNYPAARIDEMHFEVNATPGELKKWLKDRGSVRPVSNKMISPVQGRVSSEYGPRGGSVHAGIDIATGKTGVAVRSSFAGTVVRVVSGRVHDRSAAQTKNRGKPVLASGRTPNGVIVQNPDGEKQLYGHINPSVKVGQKVKAGDILGHVDISGNTSGPHLHFETWTASGKTRNPRLYFSYHGITPGSVPNVTGGNTGVKPDAGALDIQKRLSEMGYYRGAIDGINGNLTKTAVKKYQSENNKYGRTNLAVDGDWGRKTEAWYRWTASLQIALNRWSAVVPKVIVDGDYGPGTERGVHQVQKSDPNKFGIADKIVGPRTSAALGIAKKP